MRFGADEFEHVEKWQVLTRQKDDAKSDASLQKGEGLATRLNKFQTTSWNASKMTRKIALQKGKIAFGALGKGLKFYAKTLRVVLISFLINDAN